jgi:polar amino acid transport system permease protein
MTAPDVELPVATMQPGAPSRYANRLARLPWWLFLAVGLGVYVVYSIFTDERTNRAFWFVLGQEPEALAAGDLILAGILMTLFITVVAYSVAIVLGLIVGLARVSQNVVVYNVASFYVEIIRGIPMIVLLMAVAFVGTSSIVNTINGLGEWLVSLNLGIGGRLAALSTRDINMMWRGILALGIGYGAFSAEIFRAGIESIEKGQMEAARALGMSYFQAMRYIILPQAIRRVLPALGNDFVAMLKDSALVSILGVREMTQLNRLYINSTFNYVQGFAVLSFLYLTMTILLSRGVRLMERRMSRSHAA